MHPGDTFGPFLVTAVLGRCASGEVVYRAAGADGAEVALRVYPHYAAPDPGAFGRRAAALGELWHPNIARVLGAGAEGGRSWSAVQHVAGPTLRNRLRECGRLAPEDVAPLAARLFAALGYLHGRGEVHGGLTPSELAYRPDGTVALLGLDRLLTDQAPADPGAVRVMGNPMYLAPEVLAGGESPAGDLYAAGVVLFEALTGRRPYPDAVFEQVEAKLLGPPSRFAPGVPARLAALADRLLAPCPADRPTAAEAAASL